MRLLNKHFYLLSLFSILLLAGVVSCVKKDFDEPPTGGEPVNVTPNITIADLKKLHVTEGGFDKITEDLIIGGQVVMDDRSGNYYKTLVIQDASGGIEIKFNDGYLYNQFPVGRTMYIYCKDLLLTDYNGLPQLTGSLIFENGVPSGVGLTELQVRNKVVKGPISDPPAPKTVGVKQVSDAMLSTLIKLENVQFVYCDAGRTYADAVTQYSLNRILEDCSGNEIILRTSGFADFASARTPTGNGTLTGVLGKYGNDYQLYIRNQDDVSMTGNRCGSSGGPVTGTLTDISAIRALYTGTTTSAPAGLKIKGIVISDRLSNNLNNRNLYIQDGTAGIVVRFQATHCFELGDEIEVNVSNQEISEFNGLRQINNVPLENAQIMGSGKSVTPREATVAGINANFDAWESTLVQIKNATITGGATLAGSKTVNDGTGNIVLFTANGAAFSGLPVPSGAVTITAIVTDFNLKEIALRNAGDIQQ